ncbi:uncharacterized protein F5Z01DRAFT_626721 [Emericellopsis atlantica]|uniref:Zn(2)-C6 fungal-type domain-containing protein n=1 Tax=Emericellopsis atlantica TaxID=2614577 RepID=A0A9P8CMC2_9HYPO|nr:uncharacterized protein F5Z01DRAFT_626721 [Emericellopsis atlantica]KAG9251865.1 hypothetical protein F5Z01DRAFT_626721 [Emericellopsis atlantica]
MATSVARSSAQRAGGACVRCRKGKTKCVYETGEPPCRNCAKGPHECYLPSERMAYLHGQAPGRPVSASHSRPPRDAAPGPAGSIPEPRPLVVASTPSANRTTNAHKEFITNEHLQECERVVLRTFPACVAFHKTSILQDIQAPDHTLEPVLIYSLLAVAARTSRPMIRRYGSPTAGAETWAAKALGPINVNLNNPTLADVQALCLVIIHEWGSGKAVAAYIFLGQAVRMLQMYRIVNSHNSGRDDYGFVADETQRRTLWLLYMLDCLLTSTPGRRSALTEADYADVSLPCSEDHFDSEEPVYVKTLAQQLEATNHSAVVSPPPGTGEMGDFGFIILAATIWREVVAMLTTNTIYSYREESVTKLLREVDNLRAMLPYQLADKPGQLKNHVTKGTGDTFAMLHCFLHCSSIFLHRRRLLQEVTATSFHLESFRMTPKCHDLVDRLFTSCHAIITILEAVHNRVSREKELAPCFTIFMSFSIFTAGATVAYLSLKGLTPLTAVETAAHIVENSLRFMSQGTEHWPLMSSWLRHLTVMQRVLHNDAASGSRHNSNAALVRDEVSSNADTADHDQRSVPSSSVPPQHSMPAGGPHVNTPFGRGESEPPVTMPRRPGITTINGGPTESPAPPPTNSPPHGSHYASYAPPAESKQLSPPAPGSMHGMPNNSHEPVVASKQDMTAPELCAEFERQLLEMDDLAAFMGGGV